MQAQDYNNYYYYATADILRSEPGLVSRSASDRSPFAFILTAAPSSPTLTIKVTCPPERSSKRSNVSRKVKLRPDLSLVGRVYDEWAYLVV